MTVEIIVAHHLVSIGEELPPHFIKVCSPAGDELAPGFSQIFRNQQFYQNNNPVWGEIIPLLKTTGLTSDNLGLFHYRRFILPPRFCTLRYTRNSSTNKRHKIAQSIVKRVSKNPKLTYVPKAIDLSKLGRTVYTDYVKNHSDSLEILHAGAAKLDAHFAHRGLNLDVLESMKSEVFLYPCNILIAPADVFIRWRELLTTIVDELDTISLQTNPTGYQSRWGGFVVERLFSTWLQFEMRYFGLELRECPTFVFHEKYTFKKRFERVLELGYSLFFSRMRRSESHTTKF